MENNNKSFIYGLSMGVAVISSLALIILVIYIMTGGRVTCLAQCNGTIDSNEEKDAVLFNECLDSGKYDSKVSADQNLGMQLGVRGTPATFINGYLVSGALPFEAVSQVIDTLLAGEEPDFDFLKDPETEEINKVEMPQIVDSDHKTGAENGQISIVEFSDFECPFCSRFANDTMSLVEDNYKDVATIVFKHFPLSFHQYAKTAAVATECAAEQDKFWEMHDKLFDLSAAQNLNTANIKNAALELGLE